MKILFIGGNGNISWWCVQRALEKGYEVWELNRAATRATRRPVQKEVHQIICDVRDGDAMRVVLKDQFFDVVCDFISFNGKQAEQMIDLFLDKTNQYIVISSEAVYKRKRESMTFHEDSEKYGLEEIGHCNYIKGKIEVENIYNAAFKEKNFPITVVRPGYTYDIIIPTPAGGNCYTAIQKMKEGKPLIMYGDGNNLCAPMHSKDFSRYFIELCGRESTLGESYHIVGQELLAWNTMEQYVMEAFHVSDNGMIHIAEKDLKTNPVFEYDELTKQHMSDYLFDNQKINEILTDRIDCISFKQGIYETADLLMSNDNYRRIDAKVSEKIETIYEIYGR